MSAQALTVMLISSDRKLLRHLSRFLTMFGYQVQQVAGWQQALLVAQERPPQIVILDALSTDNEAMEFCRRMDAGERHAYVYTILLGPEPEPQEVTAALTAGVDDFLRKPLVYGELLMRLRAAARTVEFERRIRQQEGIDAPTGLANRAAFERDLARRLSAPKSGPSGAACLVVDIDFLGRINRLWGRPAGDSAITAVAELLAQYRDAATTVACFGGGRFGLLLSDTSPGDAVARAEEIRHAVADAEIPPPENGLNVTASVGVALAHPGHGETRPAEAVHRALEALRAAKSSGRDCVVRHGQFHEEAEAWSNLAAPGKLFEGTTARDVMTPTTLMLGPGEPAAFAVDLLRHSQVDAVMVVDAQGKLLGVVTGGGSVEDTQARVSEIMTTDVVTFDEGTSFAELVEFFTGDPQPLAVVVYKDRPLGLITPDRLASLSDPITLDSFASRGTYCDTSEYLVIGDAVPAG